VTLKFHNAGDFLEYVRFVYSRSMSSIEGAPNLEFLRIHQERAKDEPIPPDPHEHIVELLWPAVSAALPTKYRESLGNAIAVGTLDQISVNALCIRSPEGFVAIVVNRGLLTFLNKISKLQVASAVEGSVLYCNRGPAKDITPLIASQWFRETCEHYRDTGKPLGPQIHLTPEATLQHHQQLHFWEVFVLAHELGHVISGHLEDGDGFHRSPTFGMLETYMENESHIQEVEADVVAYRVLRRHAHSMEGAKEELLDQQLLAAVTLLFNLLFLIGAGDSKTHPNPLDRLCNIVAEVYGEDVAERLAKTYEDRGLLQSFFNEHLIAKSSPDWA
jgi:hypothetical protein